jgi:hypothetical protein
MAKTVKVCIDADEWYPFWDMWDPALFRGYGTEVYVSEEEYKAWQRFREEFETWQRRLEKLAKDR